MIILLAFIATYAFCNTSHVMTVDGEMLKNITTSLVSDSMGFIREVLTNSIDATVRLTNITGDERSVINRDIRVVVGKNEIKISDGGIGMTEDDLVNCIGRYGGSQSRGVASCTGTYGMGFYTVFMVAEEVEVISRKYGEDSAAFFRHKYGDDHYVTGSTSRETHGTTVILKLWDSKKGKISKGDIKNWIHDNILDAGIISFFSIFVYDEDESSTGTEDNLDKEKVEESHTEKGDSDGEAKSNKDNSERKGKIEPVTMMKLTESNDLTVIEKIYKSNFPYAGKLLFADHFSFTITQRKHRVMANGGLDRTDTSLQPTQVFFDGMVFIPEASSLGMMFMGENEDGKCLVFVNGMRIKFEPIDFIKPFYIILRSNEMETNSTREDFLNGPEDSRKISNALTKMIATSLRKLYGIPDKREKVVDSYDDHIKSAIHSKDRSIGRFSLSSDSISSMLFEICSFYAKDGKTKAVFEILESAKAKHEKDKESKSGDSDKGKTEGDEAEKKDGDEKSAENKTENIKVYYTNVPSSLVNLKNGMANPSFDNLDVDFFFASGVSDQQILSMFKTYKDFVFVDVLSEEFDDVGHEGNKEFEEWVGEFAGDFLSKCVVSKRLARAPFSLKISKAMGSAYRAMIGERRYDRNPFKSMLESLPTLEYNPAAEEFKMIMAMKEKDKQLAEEIVLGYIVSNLQLTGAEINERATSYVCLVNILRRLLGVEGSDIKPIRRSRIRAFGGLFGDRLFDDDRYLDDMRDVVNGSKDGVNDDDRSDHRCSDERCCGGNGDNKKDNDKKGDNDSMGKEADYSGASTNKGVELEKESGTEREL